MTGQKWVVYGSGGHGKVLADAVLSRGEALVAFVDDDEKLVGGELFGAPIRSRGWLQSSAESGLAFAFGIGDNFIRERLQTMVANLGRFVFPPLVHPDATVARSASLGEGTSVCARVVVNACARVGAGVILNTSSIVEHDVVVEDFVHLSPGACLAGGARVGRSTHVALGAIVLENVTVGGRSLVGAGSVVRSPIPDGVVAFGVPARIRRALGSKEAG